ncbi:hypothetical protein G7Y79_00060g092320 [Physcia stellaris]|nr:hypothetical protein G7Y79_00060g092320 [Physcia stellaris]
MADQEEDFSSLPLPDRFAHKNWKVRKQGYEDAAKAFEVTPDESDPAFRPFLVDSGLWKGAVADSNVAAQQEGINALCAFLKFGGPDACKRSRNATISPIVEKGLSSTRAATKQSALEALLLYIELDKSDPVIEDLLPSLSHKQPKIIAATLAAMTAIYHAYGVKIVDPKPVLKQLPKAFGHADKNVRAEASNLAVELYRWLREAMKTLFWNDLKPVQQQDLEKLFESVKQEPPPTQERLLRSQQAAKAAAPAAEEGLDGEEGADEAEPEIDVFDLAEPVDVLSKVPKDFNENMASSKWKDRKETLDALFAAANTDRIKDGPYDDIVAALAKSMKDANIAVVTVAANCIEVLAKGLRKSFAKYRGRVMAPMMEKLKEKKQSVADALGAALDAIFASTGLSECLEDILEFLKHKNPQVKAETLRFLIRCLKTTREAPSKPETKSIAEAATKLLTESTEATRSGGAEVLGTLMKIMGERAMGPYMEGLDEIRKTKIKEYFDAAEVKAKDKPKPVAPPPKAAAPAAQKKPMAKKTAPGLKKPGPRASTPQEDPPPSQYKQAPPKALPSKLGGLPKPGLGASSTSTSGLKAPTSKLGALKAPSALQSPRRNFTPPEEDPTPAPKLGRGLTGRSLGKPNPLSSSTTEPPPPPQPTALSSAERAELEELRTERDRTARTIQEILSSKANLTSQLQEVQNHNADLIEERTRNVLSIKAKETQLVRARADAEEAEQTVQKQAREMDRLRRELSRITSEREAGDQIYRDSAGSGGSGSGANGAVSVSRQHSGYGNRADSREAGYQRAQREYAPLPDEEKENEVDGEGDGKTMGMNMKRREVSPARTTTSTNATGGSAAPPVLSKEVSTGAGGGRRDGDQPVESWKRAAEVTSALKARIELMKAKQGMSSRPH